jgi:hypothetical protein
LIALNLIKRIYWVVEKGANVFGFVSALIAIWTLVYPGRAISVLEDYQARFAAAEESLDRIEGNTEAILDSNAAIERETSRIGEDTEQLVAALPQGVRLEEVYQQQNCPAGSGFPDTVSLVFSNGDPNPVSDGMITILDNSGAVMMREDGVFMNAQGALMLDISGATRPARVCLTTGHEENMKAVEYRVVHWRETNNNCDENPRFGFVAHSGGFSQVPVEEMTLCR